MSTTPRLNTALALHEKRYAPFKVHAVMRALSELGWTQAAAGRLQSVAGPEASSAHTRISVHQFLVVCRNAGRLSPKAGWAALVGAGCASPTTACTAMRWRAPSRCAVPAELAVRYRTCHTGHADCLRGWSTAWPHGFSRRSTKPRYPTSIEICFARCWKCSSARQPHEARDGRRCVPARA